MAVTRDPEIDRASVESRMRARGIADEVQREIAAALPTRAKLVILYGSQARGDADATSDIDLLIVADRHARSRSIGRVNRSTYGADQFQSAAGTLFGMHLARDGLVLHGDIDLGRSGFLEIDLQRLWGRVRRLAALLNLPPAVQRAHLNGFVRHARYVLRTAIYAQAIEAGQPAFSVTELANRSGDDALKTLLASRADLRDAPSMAMLHELTVRVERLLNGIPSIEYANLIDAIVGLGVDQPEVADAALLILDRDAEAPYTEIPRVIL